MYLNWYMRIFIMIEKYQIRYNIGNINLHYNDKNAANRCIGSVGIKFAIKYS
ncbi:hypothetical protein SPACI_053470 [Sporomusa acidovorans DSM 3132]|uniref:Uncharacterized protein n=1 Tax=Sporomusa acidovorans (strain ATCC 49682 / DSM 3132 / Mol) TaxID=1123286 RepID=A0ABZ3J9X4_SPOA4|nr:hypothetical protein SPACI_17680 [Sporomusa acidovorans DSM 3132]SDD59908.1 hypothetical protein SAMN04488499_1002165 [Sporomusa acidovorans]